MAEESMNGITKQTFVGMDESSKLNVLFDCMELQYNQQVNLRGQIEKLSKCVERKKKLDAMVSSISGMIGGIIAIVGKNLFINK